MRFVGRLTRFDRQMPLNESLYSKIVFHAINATACNLKRKNSFNNGRQRPSPPFIPRFLHIGNQPRFSPIKPLEVPERLRCAESKSHRDYTDAELLAVFGAAKLGKQKHSRPDRSCSICSASFRVVGGKKLDSCT